MSHHQHLWIPGRMPGLNEILDARSKVFQTKSGKRVGDQYGKLKRRWADKIGLIAKAAEFPLVRQAHWTYLALEPSRRRDPSNIVSGAVKLVEDSLQEAGVMTGDGWSHVLGFVGHWAVSELPGVHVWAGDYCMSKGECMMWRGVEVKSET